MKSKILDLAKSYGWLAKWRCQVSSENEYCL